MGRNLSAALPAGATIDGIEVTVEGYNFSGIGSRVVQVTLWNSGAPIGTAKTVNQALTGSFATYTWGGSSDVWGASLTEAIVEGSGFGAALYCDAASGGAPIFDYMSITIYYTEAPSEQSLTASPASVTVTAVSPGLAGDGSVNLSAAPALVEVSANGASLGEPPPDYASVEPEKPKVTLALFSPDRRQRLDVDINPRITSVQITTAAGRGFDQLLIGIAPDPNVQRHGVRYGQLPEPLETRAWTRAELYIGNYLAFEGRVGPQTVPARSLVIEGYWRALSDDDWYASTDTTLYSGGEVIKKMLAASTLPVKPGGPGEWQDPFSEHAPVEFDGRAVSDALSLITSGGDALGNDVDWFVWEDRRLHLLSRKAPKDPDYRMDIDPAKMTIVKDDSQMVSGITVEFRAATKGIATIASGNDSVTVTHGLDVDVDAEDIRVSALDDLGQAVKFYIDDVTATTFDIHLVEPERASGTATITDTTTSVNVTHGLSRTPTVDELKVTATNSPDNDPGNMWVSALGATTFTINVRNDPGASGATFTWSALLPDTMVASDPGSGGADFAWTVEAGTQRTDEAWNPEFEREFGFVRRRKVTVGGMTLAAAERIRDRLIAAAKRPVYSVRLRVGPGEVLRGPHGEPVAAYTCRSGRWGVFGDVPSLIAVSTRYDVTGEVLDVDFGSPFPRYEEQIRRLVKIEERRSRGLDPGSGGTL